MKKKIIKFVNENGLFVNVFYFFRQVMIKFCQKMNGGIKYEHIEGNEIQGY